MTTAQLLVHELRENGDRVTIGDGRELRLCIDSDHYWSLDDDGDWFGRVEWAPSRDWGRLRPEGMDGAARIINRDRGSVLWWQPPTDVTDPAELRALERELRDLIEYGYVVIMLQLWTRCNCCEQWRQSDAATIGGVSWNASTSDYLSDLLTQLKDVN